MIHTKYLVIVKDMETEQITSHLYSEWSDMVYFCVNLHARMSHRVYRMTVNRQGEPNPTEITQGWV